MRRFRLTIPLIGSLVVIAGCGGSSNSKLSYAAFSSAADKICSTANSAAKTNGQVTAQATPANAAKIDKVITLANDAIKKFQALSGPAALESVRDEVVANLQAEVKTAQAASTAAKSGDQTTYTAAIEQLAQQSQASNSIGAKLGASNCTHG
jgi:excinuclease UvrABC ATPase subunit